MKERFKIFVRNHPTLATYVANKQMTWQQFYELYDLYGEDNNIWQNYLTGSATTANISNTSNPNLVNTVKDFLGLFKGIDLNSVQKTLTSLDKAIDAFKGISGSGSTTTSSRDNYEERPKYKYFED